MSFLQNIGEEIKRIPPWGYALGAAALFVGYQFYKNQTSPAQTANMGDPSSTDSSGGSDSGGDSTTSPTPPSGPGPAQEPPPNPPNTKPPVKPPPKKQETYTVRGGDTLNQIAERFKVGEPSLYSTNENVIESTARAHGFSSSDDGHWIFPGEVLTIP